MPSTASLHGHHSDVGGSVLHSSAAWGEPRHRSHPIHHPALQTLTLVFASCRCCASGSQRLLMRPGTYAPCPRAAASRAEDDTATPAARKLLYGPQNRAAPPDLLRAVGSGASRTHEQVPLCHVFACKPLKFNKTRVAQTLTNLASFYAVYSASESYYPVGSGSTTEQRHRLSHVAVFINAEDHTLLDHVALACEPQRLAHIFAVDKRLGVGGASWQLLAALVLLFATTLGLLLLRRVTLPVKQGIGTADYSPRLCLSLSSLWYTAVGLMLSGRVDGLRFKAPLDMALFHSPFFSSDAFFPFPLTSAGLDLSFPYGQFPLKRHPHAVFASLLRRVVHCSGPACCDLLGQPPPHEPPVPGRCGASLPSSSGCSYLH